MIVYLWWLRPNFHDLYLYFFNQEVFTATVGKSILAWLYSKLGYVNNKNSQYLCNYFDTIKMTLFAKCILRTYLCNIEKILSERNCVPLIFYLGLIHVTPCSVICKYNFRRMIGLAFSLFKAKCIPKIQRFMYKSSMHAPYKITNWTWHVNKHAQKG